ncbi:MAG: hypothetical protein GX803_05620 [Lentisphaerae bacterium]|jgi:hypothetical protein|nr:hypothetical protein [Lentisphaerota bacterium]
MKKITVLLGIALCAQLLFADAESSESPRYTPAPPEPGAAEVLESYLSLLSQGDLEATIPLHDMRGMRQYLLERRLTELKARNPELTEQDIEEMSAKIQVHDLAPARLQNIIIEILEEANHAGMTWSIMGYAPAPHDIPGHLARVLTRTAGGQDTPLLIGLIQIGSDWQISPATVEEAMRRQPRVRMVAPPEPVLELIKAFWTRFQTAEFQAIYDQQTSTYRGRVPYLIFLAQAQDFLGKVGVPADWTIVRAIETQPGFLAVGVQVEGSKATQATLMMFRKSEQHWYTEDIQFEMPRPDHPATGRIGAGAIAEPDLRPNLAPDFSPAFKETTLPDQPALVEPGSGPAQPDAPEGPAEE